MKKGVCPMFIAAIVFFLSYQTATIEATATSPLEQYATKLISEGALLEPINAFGDPIQYVVAISDDLLCGVSQGRLKMFTKDNVNNVIASYWTPYRLPRTFEYYKGHIYLVQGNKGIWIFDVRNPPQIALVKKLKTPVANFAELEVKEDKLFLVNTRTNSLIVLSLANPEEPQEIAQYPLPEGIGQGCKVSIVDDRIYILCHRGLAILDAQDLNALELLGKTDIQSEISLGAFIVYDSYAYVYAGHEIRVFDISIPEAIEQKTVIKATWCSHAVLRDNHFIGFGDNGVYIYDLSDPLKPERVRKHYNNIPGGLLVGKSQDYIVDDNGKAEPLTGLPNFSGAQSRFAFEADNIVVQDKFAYAFGQGQLRILDISQGWAPKQIASVRVTCGSRTTILVDGNYLYTPHQIIDISEPTKPTIIKRLKGGSGVAIENKQLFIAKEKALEIWDVNDPSKAMMIKSISFDYRLNKVFVHKGIVYLGFYRGKLRSCRLEDDLTLTKLDQVELAKSSMGIIMDFCEEDDFLYVALNGDGIASVDIQDPQNLKAHARFNTSQFSEQIEVVDAYAYVADGSGGTVIIDMVEKGYEKKIASYPTTDWTRAIAVSGNYVYTCEDENGLAIFVSNLPESKIEQAIPYSNGKREVEQPKEDKNKKAYQPALYNRSSLGSAAIVQANSALEQYSKRLIAEGALLEPINAIGDNSQYACAINDELMCGVSRLRLKIFQKENIENVLSSYWTNARFPRIFEYYKGYIYLPQPYKGIWIFDARDPTVLRLVSERAVPFGYHTNIEVRDDKLLYVDPEEGVLVILSLDEPAEPREISRCALGENMRDRYKANIQIVGDRIYVLGRRCLAVIDGQDLYSPRLLGRIDIDSGGGGSALAVCGSYAYVYDSEDRHIFDVSNPEAIERKAATNTVRGGQWERRAVVRDTHIITFGEGVYIYDVSDPLKPELVRQHYNYIPGNFLIGKDQDYVVDKDGKAEPLTGLPYLVQGYGSRFGFSVDKIAIRDKFAYIFGGGHLRVFDISRPWSPKQVASLAGRSDGLASLPIDDNHIYTPRQIIDISEPASPTVIKKTLSTGHAVARTAKHLIIATEDSLHIWDVQIPAEAKSVKNISLGARANALCFHQGILYIGFHKPKLWSCVLEDDLTLTVLDEIDLAKSDNGIIMDLCKEDDFLYVALGGDGVASVDIRDPQNLTEYARFDTTHAQDIEVVDAYVYVAGGRGGAIIVDLAEKGNEREIASYPPAHWTRAVAVSGNYAYSGDEEYGITVFVSNLSNER